MSEFIEKNRLYIGIILVLVILAGSGILLWQKQVGNIFSSDQSEEIANLQQENQDLRNKIAELENKIKSEGSVESGAVKSVQSVSNKININSADSKTLETLPGIGSTRAQQIIDYREKQGGFKTIEEIKNIQGIGEKTFLKLKDLITVN